MLTQFVDAYMRHLGWGEGWRLVVVGWGLNPDNLWIRIQAFRHCGQSSSWQEHRWYVIKQRIIQHFENNILKTTFWKQHFDAMRGWVCHFRVLSIIIFDCIKFGIYFAVFMDLSKAFDTLDHKILIDKLHHYGIRAISLMWFESYLSKRTQYVEIDNFKSSPQTITTGVPQGSTLGPLLFLIYMNDMPQASSLFKFILYGDDTTLFSALDYSLPLDIPASSELINIELSRVGEWLIINRLSINITKTKYMLFHPRQKDVSHMTLEPTLNGEQIEQVDSFNFLGVVIDKHISWKYHTEMLSNKISKYCGVLSRLKNYLPLFILRTLYFSMVHSHLSYSLLTWGYDSNRIVKLQKRCVRIITRSKYNAHTQPLMKQLNILSVPDMLLLNSMKFYYKYKHKKVLDYFASFTLHTQGSTHDYNTRQRDDIRTNRTRINLTEKCLRNYLPKAINSIPNHILTRIDTHIIEGFASAVKHYLISTYSIECQDENCYVCQRQPRSWFANCSPLTTMCILLLYRYFVLIAHLFLLIHWGQMTHSCISKWGDHCFR